MQRAILSGVALTLLLACQGPVISIRPTERLSTAAIGPVLEQPVSLPVRYTPKPAPFAVLEPLGVNGNGTQDVRVKITYPSTPTGFRTQAFGCGEVAFAQISVAGPGLTAPIYANGADNTHHMVSASACEISATLANVPYGNLVVRIQLYDADRVFLTGSQLIGALRMTSGNQSIELSYRQMPAGKLIETLLAGTVEQQFWASQLDLTALQSLLDQVMGVGAQFPNYSFAHHPSLLNLNRLLSDLQAAKGNVTALSPSPNYVHTAGSLRFNLNGYLLSQDVDVSIDDALSPNAVSSANGTVTLTNVPPGNWWLRLSGPGYLPTRVAISVLPGQQTAQGTVTIYPPQATLTGVSPTPAVAGSSVTLTGTHFNLTEANNRVYFGTAQATVTAATATSLTVTVPALPAGTYPLSVTIGAASPATGVSLAVLAPMITALSAPTGSTGDIITITGSGFSDTDAENDVYFGSDEATLVSATTTEIIAIVPEGIAGSAAVSVLMQGQASAAEPFTRLPRITALNTGQTLAGKAALVRGQTLTLTGTNFSPTAAHNTVYFGPGIAVVATTATPTSLTALIPSTLTTPGDLPISVVTASQSSNDFTATVPSIGIDFSGGFN